MPTAGAPARRSRRRSVSGLTATPLPAATRAPASPPSSRASCRSSATAAAVRRAYRANAGPNGSANVRRGHTSRGHRKRRTVRAQRTGEPRQARSWAAAGYRSWTRVATAPHTGQGARAARPLDVQPDAVRAQADLTDEQWRVTAAGKHAVVVPSRTVPRLEGDPALSQDVRKSPSPPAGSRPPGRANSTQPLPAPPQLAPRFLGRRRCRSAIGLALEVRPSLRMAELTRPGSTVRTRPQVGSARSTRSGSIGRGPTGFRSPRRTLTSIGRWSSEERRMARPTTVRRSSGAPSSSTKVRKVGRWNGRPPRPRRRARGNTGSRPSSLRARQTPPRPAR